MRPDWLVYLLWETTMFDSWSGSTADMIANANVGLLLYHLIYQISFISKSFDAKSNSRVNAPLEYVHFILSYNAGML